MVESERKPREALVDRQSDSQRWFRRSDGSAASSTRRPSPMRTGSRRRCRLWTRRDSVPAGRSPTGTSTGVEVRDAAERTPRTSPSPSRTWTRPPPGCWTASCSARARARARSVPGLRSRSQARDRSSRSSASHRDPCAASRVLVRVPVVRRRRRPAQLGDRRQPRERHELDVGRCRRSSRSTAAPRRRATALSGTPGVASPGPSCRLLHLDEARPRSGPSGVSLVVLHVQVGPVRRRHHHLGALARPPAASSAARVVVGTPVLRDGAVAGSGVSAISCQPITACRARRPSAALGR